MTGGKTYYVVSQNKFHEIFCHNFVELKLLTSATIRQVKSVASGILEHHQIGYDVDGTSMAEVTV